MVTASLFTNSSFSQAIEWVKPLHCSAAFVPGMTATVSSTCWKEMNTKERAVETKAKSMTRKTGHKIFAWDMMKICPTIFGSIWDCMYLASQFHHDIGIFLSILCQASITQRKRKSESYKILHTWNGKVIRPKSTQKESTALFLFQWCLKFVSNSVIFLPNSTSFKKTPFKLAIWGPKAFSYHLKYKQNSWCWENLKNLSHPVWVLYHQWGLWNIH